MIINKQSIVQDLRRLGIQSGDVLYIRGDVGKIGENLKVEGNLKDFLIEALLEAVGVDGTIITASYSDLYLPWQLSNSKAFTRSAPSNCGALSRLFLKRKDCVRSEHPSSSYVSIGKYADFFVADHDASSMSYTPLGKLLELDAKILSFGCVESNCGFPTTHYVEEVLGYTKKALYKKLYRVFYYDNYGYKKLFKRQDWGGCAGRAYMFYKEYKDNNILRISLIGGTIAICSDFQDSFNLEYNLIKENPSLVSCDNPDCIYCNLIYPKKKFTILRFFSYKLWIILIKMIRNIVENKDWKDVIRKKCNYKLENDPIFFDIIQKLKKRSNED